MKQTTIHDQLYEMYSWQELGADTFTLAQKILADKKKYDRIIVLAKGGLTFAKPMVDYLKVPNVTSIQLEFYTGVVETKKTPKITQKLPISIAGERIIIFDDLVDKGDTMQLAHTYIGENDAKSIETATLISKPWSTFKVDYTVRSSEAWVVFPHEIRETITNLVKMWSKKGDSTSMINSQLLKIGFSKAEVALFSGLE
jgi:uncharacterized protein